MPSHLLADSYVAVCPEGAMSADQPVKHVAGSGEVYMDFGTAMENYCRHSERLWKHMIEHTDHVARCASGGRAARCSRVSGSAH